MNKPRPLTEDLNRVLAQTQGLWCDYREARVFVTGGTGALGGWILESLLWAQDQLDLGVTVTVLTRSPSAFKKARPLLAKHRAVRVVEGDVRGYAENGAKYTHVIHAAADVSGTIAEDTIVEGTRRMIQFAKSAGAKRFLLTSSGAVYGRQPPALDRVPENFSSEEGVSTYGRYKRRAEELCAAEQGIEIVIARCFALVGPYMPLDAHFAIGNFIRDCLKGGPIEIQGDGTAYRSYLYGSDLAVWLWTLLARGRAQEAYNVGSENAISILDLAESVVRVSGRDVTVRVLGQAEPGRQPERYVPSTQKAATQLGLRQTVELDEAILRTLKWLC